MWRNLFLISFMLCSANCQLMKLLTMRFQDSQVKQSLSTEARLNLTQIGEKCGHSIEEHYVVTEDGYILQLFHFKGREGRPPVLMMHGIGDSGVTFILRGNTSMSVSLENAGFDVWIGNFRGSKYGRRHMYLSPENLKFWKYSFHEQGYYDLPALIDYVLAKTKKKSLGYIGHSQGTVTPMVLLESRPEYNSKINVLIMLAPVAYFNHVRPPIIYLIDIFNRFNNVYKANGLENLLPDQTVMKTAFTWFCSHRAFNYRMCVQGLFFAIAGADPHQFENDFLMTVLGHYPDSISRKNLEHHARNHQLKRFAKFDYGPVKNMKRYKSISPPDYDLNKVQTRVVMYAGKNDLITSIEDVRSLRDRLPNVVKYHEMKWSAFNHIDFIWGKTIYKTLTPKVIKDLQKYAAKT